MESTAQGYLFVIDVIIVLGGRHDQIMSLLSNFASSLLPTK